MRSDSIEKLGSWRDDKEVVRARAARKRLQESRDTAEERLIELRRLEHHPAVDPWPADRSAVAILLGRAANAVRAVAPGPSLATRLRDAIDTLAGLDRQMVLLDAEIGGIELVAKQRSAVAIATAAAPLLEELIPLVDKARAVNTTLQQLDQFSHNEFFPGTPEGLMGAWSFLPEGSPEPATGHFFPALADQSAYEWWRRAMGKAGYGK